MRDLIIRTLLFLFNVMQDPHFSFPLVNTKRYMRSSNLFKGCTCIIFFDSSCILFEYFSIIRDFSFHSCFLNYKILFDLLCSIGLSECTKNMGVMYSVRNPTQFTIEIQ